MSRPYISVVISCYFEEQTIHEFHQRLRGTLEATGESYEILIVNDGSTDGTFAALESIHAEDPSVTVLDLCRNAGQAAALTAGLVRAEGERIAMMDSDLQLDPEELPQLLERFDEKGLDVVSGVRKVRRDPLGRRIASYFANRVVRRVTGHDLTDFGCTYKIFRGDLVRAHELGPRNPLQQALLLRSAGRVGEIDVNHHPRPHGRSGWSFGRLFALNLDHLLGASGGVFQWLSLFAFLIAGLTLARIVLAWLLPGSILAAPVTTGLLLNAMLLSTAFLLGVLALVGEYVIRTHSRAYGGPKYVVRTVLGKRS